MNRAGVPLRRQRDELIVHYKLQNERWLRGDLGDAERRELDSRMRDTEQRLDEIAHLIEWEKEFA